MHFHLVVSSQFIIIIIIGPFDTIFTRVAFSNEALNDRSGHRPPARGEAQEASPQQQSGDQIVSCSYLHSPPFLLRDPPFRVWLGAVLPSVDWLCQLYW